MNRESALQECIGDSNMRCILDSYVLCVGAGNGATMQTLFALK